MEAAGIEPDRLSENKQVIDSANSLNAPSGTHSAHTFSCIVRRPHEAPSNFLKRAVLRTQRPEQRSSPLCEEILRL